jgi:hypothetical protein
MIELSELRKELFLPKVFAAQCYSDHSTNAFVVRRLKWPRRLIRAGATPR